MNKKSKITKRNAINFQITLSTDDCRQLRRYCAVNKLGEKTAIKKILRTYLSDNLPKLDEEAENQLELFRPFQKNIFDKG
ncbi:MAG: hypothetical protein LBO06_05565 [Bacteroidales bacterium]|nr:hypothetical protein [Bacteroidales bacterium]